MDVRLLIKQRLEDLSLEQRDLAAAAGTTDSYISQLLTGNKLPPAPDRTDIYSKMEKFLKLSAGKLSELAGHGRTEELKKRLSISPAPLLKEVRDLILRKCAREKVIEIRAIFEMHPFGELERLVTQKLVEVAKRVAKEELDSERWLRLVAQLNGRTYEATRVSILEFLETDVLELSMENGVSFLDPLIESWNIDLANFGMEIVLNRRLASAHLKKLEFVERDREEFDQEPGLKDFLANSSMSGNATQDEIEFLAKLRFTGRRPTALYYYRELQNLRDSLNFRESSVAPLHKYGHANAIEKEMQMHSRKGAIRRWAAAKSSGKGTPKRRKP